MSQFAWTFPGGKKTIVKDTGVAGNVATTKTVPSGKRWLLTNLKFVLTTDITVQNRYCAIQTQDIANVVIFDNASSVITASLTSSRFFIFGFEATNAYRNSLGYNILEAGEDLVLSITGGQAGDSYNYLIEYLEIDTP